MRLLDAFGDDMGRRGMRIAKRLAEAGHAAYLVGGCVRDAALGRTVKDIDIATSARPEQAMELFPHAVPTGIRHGTITVIDGNHAYEVTTFRTESAYSDGRHPDAVDFISDVAGDLERRDFTVNAMAVGIDGELVDPFGGIRDLGARIIRAVGDPAARFGEDALRMLRCVRFAAELGFETDARTWAEVCFGAPNLSAVAMERVFAELDRMMAGSDPYRALLLLRESGLLRWCKEGLGLPDSLGLAAQRPFGGSARPVPASGPAADDAGSDSLAALPRIDDRIDRWALWLLRMECTAEQSDRLCKALRVPKSFAYALRDAVLFESALRSEPVKSAEAAKRIWVAAVLRHGVEAALRWLRIVRACAGHASPFEREPVFGANGAAWIEEMGARTVQDLRIGGHDVLAACRRAAGPWVNDWLQRLLAEAAHGDIPNEREALLDRIGEWSVGGGRNGGKGSGEAT